jgi:hypothetical protein
VKDIIRVCGALSLSAGIATAVHYFAFFETDVPIPRAESMGRTFGGGRFHDVDLVAQRQDGLNRRTRLRCDRSGDTLRGSGGFRERSGSLREEMPVLRRASEGRSQRVPVLQARFTPAAPACAAFQLRARATTDVIP